MDNNKMVELIKSKEDGVLDASNLPARVWRLVLLNLGMSGSQWFKLLTAYHIRLQGNKGSKELQNIKGNTTRMLSESKMAWDALVKGFIVLGFDKVEVEFKLTKNGKTQIVKQVVDLKDDV